MTLAQIVLRLIEDALRWLMLLTRSDESVRAENLMLRRQLAMFIERGIRPRRIDAATRASLAVLTRLFDWRSALVVVQPATIVRWHHAGWKLFWRMKSRPGRPPIAREPQVLIRRMGEENPIWGEERIANELLLKLGVRISPRTVRKYLPKRPPGQPRGDQRWSTFLKNHAKAVLACRPDRSKAETALRNVLPLICATVRTTFLRSTAPSSLPIRSRDRRSPVFRRGLRVRVRRAVLAD